MKLREFIQNLEELIHKRPYLLDMDVVYAKDDEGNGFDAVHYSPSVGEYDQREFEESDHMNINAVCIN